LIEPDTNNFRFIFDVDCILTFKNERIYFRLISQQAHLHQINND